MTANGHSQLRPLPRCVLIVDDNAANRKLLRGILEAEDVTVLEAADGREALELVEHEDVDAVVSDILMPNNRELDAFSYSASHDLVAPLRSISGFTGILERHAWGQRDNEAKRLLDHIRDSSSRMRDLIDDLLRLSRINRSQLNKEVVDLTALALQVIEKLRLTEPTRTVTTVVPCKLSTHGDRRLLLIVLENLLGNAWKYSAKKTAARIELGALGSSAGEQVILVRDNGAGFDMCYAGKLFGAFQRLHPKHEFPGNGVGLATVQRIIHRHGGRIWAEAKVNEGATFYFTLGNQIHLPDLAAVEPSNRALMSNRVNTIE